MLYYFLTIDKCKTRDGIIPTIEMYRNVLKRIHILSGAKLTDIKYPVECFEFKEKIINRKKITVWLHYHAIMKTTIKIIYKNVKIKDYSINWKQIESIQSMATYAGYICKDKIDKSRFMKMIK